MTLSEVIFDEVCPGCNKIIRNQEGLIEHVEMGHYGRIFEESERQHEMERIRRR